MLPEACQLALQWSIQELQSPLSLRNRQNAFPDKNFDLSIITAVLNELEIGVGFGLLFGMHTHVVFYKNRFFLSPWCNGLES